MSIYSSKAIPPATSTVYMIRHGETDWNREDRLQGHSDIPINETGYAQAKKAGETLINYKIDLMYSSDLSRALETAKIINQYIGYKQIIRSKLLRERFFGYGEGKTWKEIHQELPQCANIDQLPGVEPFIDLQKRSLTFLDYVLRDNQGQSVAVVTHWGWIEALLKEIDPAAGSLFIGNCACMKFTYRGSGWEWGGFLP